MIEAEENHLYSLLSNKKLADNIHLTVTLGELRSLSEAIKCIILTKQAMYDS